MRKLMLITMACILLLGTCAYGKVADSSYENIKLRFSFQYPAVIGKSIKQKEVENKVLFFEEKQGVMIHVSPYKYVKASEMKERLKTSGKLVTKTKTYFLYKADYGSKGTPKEVGEIYTFINKRGCVTITFAMLNPKLDWNSSSAAKTAHSAKKKILSTFRFD